MPVNEVERFKDDAFEMAFYESIVRHTPNFVEVLIALGDLYTKNKMYDKGLKVDERLSLMRPDDAVVLYNLACSYSLVSEVDKAFRTIKRAVKCGYDNFKHMEQDGDLMNLRKDARFQKYFSRAVDKHKEDTDGPERS